MLFLIMSCNSCNNAVIIFSKYGYGKPIKIIPVLIAININLVTLLESYISITINISIWWGLWKQCTQWSSSGTVMTDRKLWKAALSLVARQWRPRSRTTERLEGMADKCNHFHADSILSQQNWGTWGWWGEVSGSEGDARSDKEGKFREGCA